MTVMPDRITSKSNPRIKALCAEKPEPTPERFFIEGKHLVDMAYEHGCLLEVFAVAEVSYPGVKITYVSEDVLKKLAFSPSPSGLVGIAKSPKVEPKGKRALLLDRVQDPGNVGTILRTALAFGFDEIVLTPGTASPFGNKVIAASQGAVFSLAITEKEGVSAVKDLQKRGFYVLASALHDATNLSSVSVPDGPLCLVLGNEGQGISAAVLDCCDASAFIEMEGIDSLNVGVAGGILMYNLKSL